MTAFEFLGEQVGDEHRTALQWFADNTGDVRTWHDIHAQGDQGNRLVNQAKGIYKPAYTDFALSVRQTLSSPYADKELIYRPDGSWVYPYFQENPDTDARDREATNRGLMLCMQKRVPIGVLIQTKPKPNADYLVLGLGQVIDWQDGYFIIEKYDGYQPRTRQLDAARDWVAAELEPVPPAAVDDVREWQIRQVLKRRGQAKFRSALISVYKGRCAISGCDALDALEAAHIAPYSQTINNQVSNGILLRADLHTLFDLGLIGIDPRRRTVMISPKLSTSAYAGLAGQAVFSPKKHADHPAEDALRNHALWAGLIEG